MANPNIAKLKKKATDFEQKKQFDRALSLYIQLLEEAGRDLDDADLQLFNRVGDLLQRQGNVSEALAYYEKAVDVYAERGFLNNAIALCNKILRQSPARTTVYYKLGKISASKGFKSDAKKNFLEYADRMQKAGHVDEAFRALKEFADLCPDQDDIRLMLAEWLNKENRKSEAIEQLEVLYSKLEAEGRKAEARATIDRIKAIDPDVTPRVSGAWQAQKSNDLVFLDVGKFDSDAARRNADSSPGTPPGATPPAAPVAGAAASPPAARVPALDGLILAFDPEGEEVATTQPVAIDGFESTASLGEEPATVIVGAVDGFEAGGTPIDAASPSEVESILPPEPEAWSATPEPIPLVTGLETPRVSLSGAHPVLAPLIDEPPLSGREFAELPLAADRERESPSEHPRPEHDLAVRSELPLLPSDAEEIDLLTVLRTPIASPAIDLLELPPLGGLVTSVTGSDAPGAVASPSPLVIDEGAIPVVDLVDDLLVASSAPITLDTLAIPAIDLHAPTLSPFDPGVLELPPVEPVSLFESARDGEGEGVLPVDEGSVAEVAIDDASVDAAAHEGAPLHGVAADDEASLHGVAADAEAATAAAAADGERDAEQEREALPAAANPVAPRCERETLELMAVDGSARTTDEIMVVPSEEIDEETKRSLRLEFSLQGEETPDAWVEAALGATDDMSLDRLLTPLGVPAIADDAAVPPSMAQATAAPDTPADDASTLRARDEASAGAVASATEAPTSGAQSDEARGNHAVDEGAAPVPDAPPLGEPAAHDGADASYDSRPSRPRHVDADEPDIDLLDELTPPFMRHSAADDAPAAQEPARADDAAQAATDAATPDATLPEAQAESREESQAEAHAESNDGVRDDDGEAARQAEHSADLAAAHEHAEAAPEADADAGAGVAPDEHAALAHGAPPDDEHDAADRGSALDVDALRALVDVRQDREGRAADAHLDDASDASDASDADRAATHEASADHPAADGTPVDASLVDGAFRERAVDLPMLDVGAEADPLAINQELDLGGSEYTVDDLLAQPPLFDAVDSTEFVPDPELARELLGEGKRARGDVPEEVDADDARSAAAPAANGEEWPADAAPEVLIDGEWRDEHMGDLVSGEVSAIIVPGTDRPNRAGARFDDLSAALMWPEPVGDDGAPTPPRRTPGSSDAFFARMHTPRSTLSFGGVEAQLRRRLELDAGNLGLRRQLGEALLDQGDREEGLLELDIAMRGYEQVGDLDGARSVADIVLRVIPTSVRHHQKRVEYAVRSNDRVRLVEAYVELADSLFRSGEPEKARVVYSRVMELSPGNGRARFALGLLSEAEHARDADSERAREASVPVSPEYVVGLFDRSVPVTAAPGIAPQTISSEIPVVVEGLFVSPSLAGESRSELASTDSSLAAEQLRLPRDEEMTSIEEIVSREMQHSAANGSLAELAVSPAADDDGAAVADRERSGDEDASAAADASEEGDEEVAPFPAPSLDDEIDAAFAEPPVVEPVTPPSSGVLPTGSDYDFVGTPPMGAAALATPFAADEVTGADAASQAHDDRTADRSSRATPLPAASLEKVAPLPPTTPAEKGRLEPAATPAQSSDDDFIDLGSWLREDTPVRTTRMVTQEAAPTGDEQADFDEMLRRFKQGVAENVDDEDYDSHYDLGVAYKEMGLTDEAIAEFQKALRGDSNRVRSYEALGQCFVEKGQLQVAVTLLRRAVETTAADDQQLVGVLYLLGYASEVMARHADALGYYQRVFAVDIEFRDVAQRVA
ncbi:MAG: tetratricopeptide repeat protein, partial [Gemmatimonadaceae bacterium]|nr:tetratricopeptide repeat protein [Gemmatimonadaceae bacterium]